MLKFWPIFIFFFVYYSFYNVFYICNLKNILKRNKSSFFPSHLETKSNIHIFFHFVCFTCTYFVPDVGPTSISSLLVSSQELLHLLKETVLGSPGSSGRDWKSQDWAKVSVQTETFSELGFFGSWALPWVQAQLML